MGGTTPLRTRKITGTSLHRERNDFDAVDVVGVHADDLQLQDEVFTVTPVLDKLRLRLAKLSWSKNEERDFEI